MTLESTPPARVLLVNYNTYDQPYPVYPLGLAYIEGALREDGHETTVWDLVSPGGSLVDAVANFKPDFIGISMRNIDNAQSHNPRSFTVDLLKCIGELRSVSKVPMILGGSGFSVFPEAIYQLSGVEFGIVGEGETPMRLLIRSLQNGTDDFAQIPGLVHRDPQGKVVMVPRTRGNEGFCDAPYHDPARLKAYTAEGSPLGVQTQRGCPLKYCYCTYPLIEGRRSRFRTGKDVADELAQMAAHGVRQVFFVDSVFNTRASHVEDVCESILRAGVKINWECFLRPGTGITRESLKLMQRAGLNHIEFGSDSFSDPVLRHYGKSFTFDQIREASDLASDLNIRYTHFIIFGGPGETQDTMEETLTRASMLNRSLFFATIGMRVYPETPLWRLATQYETSHEIDDHLQKPLFYIEPPLTVDSIHNRLKHMQKTASNWAVGDPPPAFVATLAKLRRRGKSANMWEYVELMQRLGAGLEGSATPPPPANQP